MLVGQVSIKMNNGKKRRRRKRQTQGQVEEILKKAFCDNIIAGSIVTGSCDLQVVSYDSPTSGGTGVCNYLLYFTILDATALETSLNDINDNIAAKVTGFTAESGTIGRFS